MPYYLEAIYSHCTEKIFYLTLSNTVRQDGDETFAQILNRMRVCDSTQSDVNLLNTRFFEDFNSLAEQSPHWTTAPILTARNITVDAQNDAALVRNGEK